MTKQHNLTNYFLIAMPSMLDPNFFKAVIYVCEHTAEGALGIVVNRPTAVKLSEIFEQMDIESPEAQINDLPVLFGGPMHQERGFVLHRPSGEWRSSFMPADDIVVTTSRDVLQAMAENKGPDDAIVTLGYAGWGAGQLEEELERNAWLSCPADGEILFNTPYEKRWAAAAALIGIDDIYTVSGHVGHA